MKEKGLRRFLMGLCLLLCVGGGVVLIRFYRHQNVFHPEAYTSPNQLNENQIMFPQQGDYDLGEEGENDSSLWEKDLEAEEKLALDDIPKSPILFESEKRAVNSAGEAALLNEDLSLDGRESLNSTPEGTVLLPETGESGEGNVVVPGGGNGGNQGGGGNAAGNGSGNGSGGSAGGGGNVPGSGSGDGDRDENGGGSSDSGNNGQGNSGQDSNQGPVQEETPVPDPDSNPDSGTDIEDPDERPELPDDVFGNIDAFPEDGVDAEGDVYDVKLDVFQTGYPSGENLIYYGTVLDEWKMLCSIFAYVNVNGQLYRLTEFNDQYFKIGDFPKIATEDFDVTFSFRPNENSAWTEVTCEFKVDRNRLLVQKWEEGEYFFNGNLKEDETHLLRQYLNLLLQGHGGDEEDPERMRVYFPGWSEEPDGDPVPWEYQPGKPGRQVLYPLPLIENAWPEECVVNIVGYWGGEDGNDFGYLQALTGYEHEWRVVKDELWQLDYLENLDVPEHIEGIYVDNWFYPIYTKRIRIPKSVLSISGSMLDVSEVYEVDEENPNYSSLDGMLFDKEQSVLYAVPSDMEEITLPETVRQLQLDSQNLLNTIRFQSSEPPQIDLSVFYGMKLVVPANAYLTYLAAWGAQLGTNQLVADDGVQQDYQIKNGAVYSLDGKTLYRILDSQSGIFIVPEGVETIASGAMDGCDAVTALILPESLTKLESGSLTGNGLTRIDMLGTEPPQISTDSFHTSGSLKICVGDQETYEKYLEGWGTVLGPETAASILYIEAGVVTTEDGFTYQQTDTDVTLLKAPEGLTEFHGDELGNDVTLSAIGAHAFTGCGDLRHVFLPASVIRVESGAFENCASLETVVSEAAGEDATITLGDGAFVGCNRLRFAVFHAMNADVGSDVFPDSNYWEPFAYGYIPNGAQGYPDLFNSYAASYFTEEAGGGLLLYGNPIADEDAPEDAPGVYLCRATEDVAGDISLRENTLEIAPCAFEDCTGLTGVNIAELANLNTIGDYAFSWCGLTGEIRLGDTLVYLGDYAFAWCQGITSVYIDGSGLGRNPDYTSGWTLNAVFTGCSALEQVEFGDNCRISQLGAEMFSGTALTGITVPETVEIVRTGIFYNCDNLEYIHWSSEKPPQLISYYPQVMFDFGFLEYDELTGDPYLNLPAGFCMGFDGINPDSAEWEDRFSTYLNTWQYQIMGAENADELTEDELENGIGMVYQMFGLAENIIKSDKELPDAATPSDAWMDVEIPSADEEIPDADGELAEASPSDAWYEVEEEDPEDPELPAESDGDVPESEPELPENPDGDVPESEPELPENPDGDMPKEEEPELPDGDVSEDDALDEQPGVQQEEESL